MKRHITWFALVLVAIAASLAATDAASAGGATQVDGVQTLVSLGDLSDPADDVYWMAGYGDGPSALIGLWRTTSFQLGVFTPSGVVTGTGTEAFEGCLDANGDASCGGSEPTGTLEFSFELSAKYDPITFAQQHGRCHHPITGGAGGFAGATGGLHFKDDPVNGCSYYPVPSRWVDERRCSGGRDDRVAGIASVATILQPAGTREGLWRETDELRRVTSSPATRSAPSPDVAGWVVTERTTRGSSVRSR